MTTQNSRCDFLSQRAGAMIIGIGHIGSTLAHWFLALNTWYITLWSPHAKLTEPPARGNFGRVTYRCQSVLRSRPPPPFDGYGSVSTPILVAAALSSATATNLKNFKPN